MSHQRQKQRSKTIQYIVHRTVSAEPFHTAPSVGTGTIQDSAKPVSSEKDPGRGRRFLPAVPAPSKRESAPGAMRVSPCTYRLAQKFLEYDDGFVGYRVEVRVRFSLLGIGDRLR